MLPKKNRVDRKKVEQIFKSGAFLSSENMSFKFILPNNKQLPEKTLKNQVSFVVPKVVTKSAVRRNLLRRLGYNAIKPYLNTLPAGTIGVFVFKKYIDNKEVLENEVKNILKKIQY